MTLPLDPLHELQASARRCGYHAHPGRPIARVVILDADGRKIIDVVVPPPIEGEYARGPAPARPPVSGWDFSEPIPRFDGANIALSGRKLEVLRVLAETDGPVPAEQLRTAIWDRYQNTDEIVRWTVGELQKALKKLFPDFDGNPITTTGNGYVLSIR